MMIAVAEIRRVEFDRTGQRHLVTSYCSRNAVEQFMATGWELVRDFQCDSDEIPIPTTEPISEEEAAKLASGGAAGTDDDGKSDQKSHDDGDDSLLGSSTQPSTFKMADGSEMQLGEVVQGAFKRTRMKVATWNGLSEEEREKRIATFVETLELAESSD